MKTPTLLMAAVAAVNLRAAAPLPTEFPIARGDLQTRDPFVVVDRANGRYCLFRTYYVEPGDPAGDYFGMTGRGVQVSESTDLEHWSEAKPVLEIPEEFDCKAVWAPEVHSYKGKWYIFTTLNYRTKGRGTWTFVSDDLRGPYRPMAKRSVTPVDWWCLDGTLWVEDGKPYMVFCHEWQQIVDGEMCYVPLTDDLSAADGEPVTIFKASDGPHVRPDCLVTDGPFLERTADGGLEMIWSSHLNTGAYCVFKVRSESGKLAGPWKRHETIFDADGGHAMLFTDLQGRRRIALHSPNKPGTERPFFLPYDGTTKRELKSPDGRNSIVFTVGETLAYQIFRDGKAMTEPAEVALELEGGPTLGERPKLLDTVRTEREEKIATPIYKKSEITGVTRFMTLSFADGWSVEAAARDDGVAFRHVTSRGGKMVVKNERLPLRFASRDQQVIACADWACYDPDDRFQNSWEGVYHQLPLSEAPTNTSEAIWYTPVTFLSDGAAMCVTESDLRDYPGWCLVGGGDGRSLEGIFAGYPTKLECVGGEGGDTRGIGERVLARAGHIAETDGTRAFPWRVFMLASEPADLIASDIVMALAEPASGDFSWVKPGKVAWEWWNDWNVSGVDFKAGINTKTYEKYIDFAAEYGLEYVILDLGWSVGYDVMRIAPGMDVAELIRYGKARGVGIILWSTASQFIGRIDEVMDTYKAMGAAGFKVDYMDRNDQLMVVWLEEIARHAAERCLVVDYHGMYKPTGLQRKYPNILNFEGVHGLEQMKWEKETTQPVHDCLMAYTRLAAGPLDYTPGAMRNCRREGWAPVHGRPGSLGTRCHQLGLAVILEAPLQMLCDSPTQYRKNAECARFLAEVPTVWDEIRPLGGVPGKSVVLARRKGDVWYVGAIGAWDEQTVEIDTSFLAAGEWRLTAFADGVNSGRDPEDYSRTVRTVGAGEKLVYTLMPGGGLALRLEPMRTRTSDWPLVTIRQAYGPLRQPERTKEVLALHRRYPGACDEMWLAHGAGACLEDVRTAFEKLASYRPILEDLGIAVGFQQGVTLGHQDITAEAGGGIEGRIADFPDDIWQRDEKGKIRRMFCPRAPALHAYETEYLKIMGETLSPESIWLDDDLRLGLGVPGCFCDRCLAAFSVMCGEPLSREKLVARLRGGAEKDPIRRVWRKFKSESLAEYCKVVRTAVDGWKAPPRLALQTVGSCEMGSGVDWFPALRALSGPGKRPVGVRAGHGNYCENFGELLPKLLWVARESERCRDVGFVASVAYEQENYRREILHKSVGAALIESALALFAGCDALTEYRWDAARDEPLQDCGEFLSGLEAWRPFYERVSRVILATRAAGLSRFVGSDVDLLSGDTIDVSTDDDLQRCGVPIAPDTAPKATVRYVDRWSLPAMNAADVQSLAEGRLVVDASVVDGLCDAYGAPVADALASGRWKAYPLARFRRSVNQLPTTAEWNELLDLLDEMGKVPVRLEYPRSFRIWPRVDDAGRLRALGVWNMSIGGVTPTVAKVAATGIARACSPDGKKVDIAINEGRMLIPALPAMGVLWIEFE